MAGCSSNVHALDNRANEMHADQITRDTCAFWKPWLNRGECRFCAEPQWCDDESYADSSRVKEPGEWLRRYAGKGAQQRQCVWKPSQRARFEEVTRQYMMHMKAHGADALSQMRIASVHSLCPKIGTWRRLRHPVFRERGKLLCRRWGRRAR